MTEENPNEATNNATVAARSRRGVSHVMCWACNHDLAPLAPAAAAITDPVHRAGQITAVAATRSRLTNR